MSLRRYAKRRDANEAEIVSVLRAAGADVDLLDRPVDLLIGYRGTTVLAEVKTPTGRVQGHQQEWLEHWRGGARVILRTVEDAMAVLDAIRIGGVKC